MQSNYVGRFGDTLRRLTALEAPQTGMLRPGGPEPVASAFSAAPTRQARDPASAFEMFGEGPDTGDESAGAFGRAEQEPVTPKKLWSEMPDAAKNKLIKNVETSGVNIASAYDKAVAAGEIEPPAEYTPSKQEKFGLLTEVLLRHASNVGRGLPGPAASAEAVLATRERRGALQTMEEEKARAAAEAQRAERNKYNETARLEGREDTKATTKRQQELDDLEASRKHDIALAEANDRAAALREKGRNVQVFTAENGDVMLIDKDTGTAVPVEAEVDEEVTVPGRRGRPGAKVKTGKKVKKPVKGTPRYDASGVDQDKLVWARVEAEKLVRKAENMDLLKRRARAEGVPLEDLVQQQIEGATQRMIRGTGSSEDDPLGLRQ